MNMKKKSQPQQNRDQISWDILQTDDVYRFNV